MRLNVYYSLKALIPVKFSFHTSLVPRSSDSTPVEAESSKKKEDQQDPVCPSCKKGLSNNVLMFCAFLCVSSSFHLFPEMQ